MVLSLIALAAIAQTLIVIVLYALIFRPAYRLWSSQAVPNFAPTFPMGNLTVFTMFRNFGDHMHEVYQRFHRSDATCDYGGLFFLNKPVLLVLSPEFARTVLVRDFATFVNRGVYFDRSGDPLSNNLFFIEGDDWRRLRQRMMRAFTAGKVRAMFGPLNDVGDELLECMDRMMGSTGGTSHHGRRQCEMELTEVLFRFNTDVIGSCAFGIRCRTLQSDRSEFREIGKKMMHFNRVRLFKMYVAMLFRREARALGFRLVDADVSRFITQVVREAIAIRRDGGRSSAEKSSGRQDDFLQIMIDLLAEEDAAGGDRMTVEDIAANVFVFFFAGFETSSTVMAFALYELAQNPDVQTKACAEIEAVLQKHGGQMTNESMGDMVYLEQIINESMRKHPSVATLHRVSVADYRLPNGAVMPAGTYVVVPVLAFHRDPKLFPDPERFDPDRFSEENRESIRPYSFLPFGEGPRICIGLKFGILQCKLGLAKLLQRYRFGVGQRTKIPLEIDSVTLLHLPKGGVWLTVEDRATGER